MIQRTTLACLLIVGLSGLVTLAEDVSVTVYPDRVVNRIETQQSLPVGAVRDLGGFVGGRIAANREGYVKTFDIDGHTRGVEEKKHRAWWWIGEQPGKWLESAALCSRQAGDKQLEEKAREILARLVAAQEPSGYLGITDPQVRSPQKPLRGMDPYELYFMLHGLITAHEQWDDESALTAARKLGDYFAASIGPGKAEFWPSPYRPPHNINTIICPQFTWVPEGTPKAPGLHVQSEIAGHTAHYGWEGTLLIDPMLRLYQVTGEQRYLDWSKWVVASIDKWSGWDAFSKLDQVADGTLGVHQLQPYVHAHTFHMNFLGFLRLYEVTGDPSLLRKVKGAWDDVDRRQRYITGGVSVGEHYEPGHKLPIGGHVVETCASMSWIELTQSLLELTGEVKYADAIERLMLNHVLAAQTIDGDCNRYHTPLSGFKPGGYFHGPDCCTGSGHRLLSLLPSFFYAQGRDGLYVNQFVPSTAQFDLPGPSSVRLNVQTRYPHEQTVAIRVELESDAKFTLNIRIPGWCESPSLCVNGEAADVTSGSYARLDRTWKSGDTVTLELPAKVKWIQRHDAEAEDNPWALVRGPVVYAIDTVWWDDDQGPMPHDVGHEARCLRDRELCEVPAGPRAMGPFIETDILLVSGETACAKWVPFANVGHWYREGSQQPAKDSKAYSYAVWLQDSAVRPNDVGRVKLQVDIHVDQATHSLPKTLYGVFYEDINYAADGGLYAELVQNRSFEYFPTRGRERRTKGMHPLCAWSKVERGGAVCQLSVEDKTPLNKNNTKYVRLSIDEPGEGVGLRNDGFEGIRVVAGDKYAFSFYARRTETSQQPVTVAIDSESGETLATAVIPGLTTQWKKYEVDLEVSKTDDKASLAVVTGGEGDVFMDMISLFPHNTFKNRKNGLRKDLAQAVADMKPATFRFPGGCIVHGSGLDNVYRWKDTIGDVAERKPNWNRWGYHQTYGLGYFEYFQFCEDIGAEPIPILPVGVSCGFEKPFENADMDKLQPWIDDALDLIEFANGPADSRWGSIRAKMGHAEPFHLKYIGLGNEEHHTPEFEERFPHFVKAVRAKYPEIKIAGTSGLGPGIPIYDFMTEQQVDLSDEHYYMHPDWFIENRNRFDSFDRSKPKIYVGEYGSQRNAQYNAVAEAVFLTGVERNADIVHMTAYAPLLARYGFNQWNPNLIWFDHKTVVRTPNYYVQQLFSSHKGDHYLANKVTRKDAPQEDVPARGRIGVGTWNTSAAFDDVKLTVGSEERIRNDFGKAPSDWEVRQGAFEHADGVYRQDDLNATPAISMCKTPVESDTITYSLRAKKTGGDEGFLIVFGARSSSQFYWWNIGGWGNTKHAIEAGNQGYLTSKRSLASRPGSIKTDVWYDVQIDIKGRRIRCFLNDELIHDVEVPDKQHPIGISVAKDDGSGDVILKMANPTEKVFLAQVNLHGVENVAPRAKVITLQGRRGDGNSLEHPDHVKPVESNMDVATQFTCKMPAMSVQFVRIGMEANPLKPNQSSDTDCSAYLMAYFGPQEKLFYAHSNDARNWTSLSTGNPVWSPPFVRDPFINRVNGTFHLVHTTGWAGNTIGHWESKNLIDWVGGPIQVVDASKEKCWAPEFFYCKEEDVFYVYWASLHDGHHAMHYLKTKDWKNIKPGDSAVYYDIGIHDIDLTVVEHDGTYYGFHKPGDVGDKMGNRLSFSRSLDPSKDSFAKDGSGRIVFADEVKPTEGPEVIKLIGEQKWYVYGDPFNDPMQAWETTDFAKFTRVSVKTPKDSKHCSMIPITQKELKALLTRYPSDPQ